MTRTMSGIQAEIAQVDGRSRSGGAGRGRRQRRSRRREIDLERLALDDPGRRDGIQRVEPRGRIWWHAQDDREVAVRAGCHVRQRPRFGRADQLDLERLARGEVRADDLERATRWQSLGREADAHAAARVGESRDGERHEERRGRGEARDRPRKSTKPGALMPLASIVEPQGQGVTTGQAVAPVVVQVTRPWIAGLIGEFAVT